MQGLLGEYKNVMTLPYVDDTLPTIPNVTAGMTKVKYNSTSGKWEKVTDDTVEWYNYANKEWANVVLGDATWNSDGTLDESKAYTQLVWIPRFAYKITSQYHTEGSTAGNIEVVFIDSNNQNKSKTVTYSTTYPTATVGGGMDDFVVHPAFDYGGIRLTGFWVGKFESSHTACTTTASTGEAAYTGNEVMTVKANVTSWRNLTINQMYNTCLAMNKSGNPYGLSSNDSVVDPHLIKNDEWGAVAYLSKSAYGKETEEVYINNSSTYITGNAGGTVDADAAEGVTNAYNIAGGVKASTTGNITGVYDMSGGAWEYTAAYVTNGHGNLTTNGANLVAAGTSSKYRNVYSSTVSNGSSAQAADYALSTPAKGHYGDAIYETCANTIDTTKNASSWYSDYSYFPESDAPFFRRSGFYNGTSYTGLFYFDGDSGEAFTLAGFHVVVTVF